MTGVSSVATVLDNPIWLALTGPHAAFGEVRGAAARYRPDVSPFAAVAGPGGWDDLAALAGPGVTIGSSGPFTDPPPGWTTVRRMAGVQLVGTGVRGAPDPEAVALTAADVPEMLDLVARTDPGPFARRTYELGTYLGVRRGGALVAMAGERMHPPGWTEISAVCTDPAFRGQGLAAGLVRAVAHHIRERGETPFLHTSATNATAIRLYESLGFEIRRKTLFSALRAPADPR